jgi:hypothetical protein
MKNVRKMSQLMLDEGEPQEEITAEDMINQPKEAQTGVFSMTETTQFNKENGQRSQSKTKRET